MTRHIGCADFLSICFLNVKVLIDFAFLGRLNAGEISWNSFKVARNDSSGEARAIWLNSSKVKRNDSSGGA